MRILFTASSWYWLVLRGGNQVSMECQDQFSQVQIQVGCCVTGPRRHEASCPGCLLSRTGQCEGGVSCVEVL